MKRNIRELVALGVLMFTCHASADVIFNSFNADGTQNNPPIDPVFEVTNKTVIANIVNYHWNNGSGVIAEQINGSIGLRRVVGGVDGEVVGTWPAVTRYSPLGPPAYWDAVPNIVLAPGFYKVIDSDHATWSYTDSDDFGYLELTGAGWQPGVGFTVVTGDPVITVTNLDDSGPGSLRQAIADAAPGATIDFAVTGTITLTSGELVIANDLTITGPGVANLTIDGNHASRVLLVTNGTVFISSLTISNGYAPGSGGAIANNTALTISNCCLTACNVFEAGPSTGAGGIANDGNLVIIDSTMSKNGRHEDGVTAYWTGGIMNFGTLKLVDSAVVENSGIVCGGVLNYGLMDATNSTISDNWGTGILNEGGKLWLQSSTICSNAGVNGFGIINSEATAGSLTYVGNSIVAGNKRGDLAGSLLSLDFNLIQNTSGVTISGLTANNIYGKDPLLGPLADNGGPTPTHALLPGSPAIDHGSSGGLATDQRGQLRGFNFPAYFDAADGSDIGAYELQERAQTGPVFTVNTTDDADDGLPGIAHCSLREAIAAANANADTNTIDFATAVPGLHTGVTGTITLTNGELTVSNSAAITGPGAANLTISGNRASRVFQTMEYSSVTITGLTVADGNASGTSGSQGYGGGILKRGALTVNNCVMRNNSADLRGGAIYDGSWDRLTVVASVLASNIALGEFGGAFVSGGSDTRIISTTIHANSSGAAGGVICFSGSLWLSNCTISGNSAVVHGGGIVQSAGTSLFVDSCTICSNIAPSGGGIVANNASIRNTILAGNTGSPGPDCTGGLNSLDYNLIQNTNGCAIVGETANNLYNQDPLLGPLADLGGPTPTHALRFDSPALDAGHSGGLTTDQRGLPRPIDDPNAPNADGGDGSDIGAYEVDPILRITAIEKVGADIRLRFNTLFGRTYGVESEDNLDNSWGTLTNNIPGTGGSIQVLDTGAANLPRRFYRAVMVLP